MKELRPKEQRPLASATRNGLPSLLPWVRGCPPLADSAQHTAFVHRGAVAETGLGVQVQSQAAPSGERSSRLRRRAGILRAAGLPRRTAWSQPTPPRIRASLPLSRAGSSAPGLRPSHVDPPGTTLEHPTPANIDVKRERKAARAHHRRLPSRSTSGFAFPAPETPRSCSGGGARTIGGLR